MGKRTPNLKVNVILLMLLIVFQLAWERKVASANYFYSFTATLNGHWGGTLCRFHISSLYCMCLSPAVLPTETVKLVYIVARQLEVAIIRGNTVVFNAMLGSSTRYSQI